MPLFDYTGQLSSGALFDGTIEAGDHDGARALLAQLGVRVTTLRPARRAALATPLTLDEFTFFNEQLAALTKASIPLEEGLRQLAADVGSRRLKRLLLDLAGELSAGTPLEQALEKHRRRFPPQYAGVVAAGLKTGDLGGTLYGLTTHLRLQSNVRRNVLEAGAYPLVVLFLTLVLVSGIMRYVVPGLRSFSGELMAEMASWQARPAPGSHQSFMFAAADVWPSIEIPLYLLFLVLIVAFVLLQIPAVAGVVPEWLVRHMPGFGRVYWSSVLARFAHTTALGAYSGTPLPELVAAGGAASGSRALQGASQRVAEKLQTGEALAAATEHERLLPALWVCAVEVAAPRGDLAAVLAEIARTYELRAQHAVATVRAVLGPILLIIVAVVLGATISNTFAIVGLQLISMINSVMGV